MKKGYLRPEIRTENITVGVYGDYGSESGGGNGGGNGGGQQGGGWSPIHIFNPLFHWCCS